MRRQISHSRQGENNLLTLVSVSTKNGNKILIINVSSRTAITQTCLSEFLYRLKKNPIRGKSENVLVANKLKPEIEIDDTILFPVNIDAVIFLHEYPMNQEVDNSQ